MRSHPEALERSELKYAPCTQCRQEQLLFCPGCYVDIESDDRAWHTTNDAYGMCATCIQQLVDIITLDTIVNGGTFR